MSKMLGYEFTQKAEEDIFTAIE